MNNVKKIIMCSLLLATVSMVTACGTVKGFGQDVSKTGREIQKAAN